MKQTKFNKREKSMKSIRKKGKTDSSANMMEIDKVARAIVNSGADIVSDANSLCDNVEEAATDLARLPGFDEYVQMLDLVVNRLNDHIERIASRIEEIKGKDAAS